LIGRTVAIKTAAVAAIATAVVLCMVALGYAAYHALKDYAYLPPAGAALALAVVMALVAAVIAWWAFGRKGAKPEEPASLQERIIGLAKERPIVATAAGLAAAFIFLRNPALATIVAAALTGAPTDHGKRRR